MRNLSSILLCILLFSCGKDNYRVAKIIDGNTIQLENGSTVVLEGVSKSSDNLKILEKYLRGEILLFDKNNEEISPSTNEFAAIVYNSDGDCINDLLIGVETITNSDPPKIQEMNPEEEGEIVPMINEGGVFVVPIEVNDISMYFIFDTGASLISISSKEANYMFTQGKLSKDDIIGKEKFSDANGDISEGTIVNLTKVKIGRRVLTKVHACVIDNQNAPLLLGQSALQKFGRITIDNEKNQIIFN